MKNIILLFVSFLFLSSTATNASLWNKAEEKHSEVTEEPSVDSDNDEDEAELDVIELER